APPWLLNLVRSPRPLAETATTRASAIHEGARNNTLYRLARSLKAKGLSFPAIAAALHAENEARCIPPLPASEVDDIAQHAATQADHPTFVPFAPTQDIEAHEDAAGTESVARSLPSIVVTNRELRDLTEDGLDALRLANAPPTLFQRG